MRPRPAAAPAAARRAQVVVATGGNLYPCAPMVGEDRDDAPGAALRIGHLGDGAGAIAERVARDGAGCDRGGGCACAAYLETGDRAAAGPNGRWFGDVCAKFGIAIAAALDDARRDGAVPVAAPARSRRPFLLGLAAAAGGLAVGVPALLALLSEPVCPAPAPTGQIVAPQPATPEPPTPEPPPLPVPGGMAPPPPPAPEPRPRGDVAAPPEPAEEPRIEGDMAYPPEEALRLLGRMRLDP
jgi:hypothetical protein